MIFVLGLLWLLAIGVPLFALFGAAGLGLFLDSRAGSWEAVAIDVFGAQLAESPSLMTIPLLTFAGCVLAAAQTPQRLLALGRAWLGWTPPWLAAVVWLVGALLTTFLGRSSTAAIAVMLLPVLVRMDPRTAETRPRRSRDAFAFAAAWGALQHARWELTIPLVLVAAQALGAERLHEAAAITALYVLTIAAAVQREITLARDLPAVALETVLLVGAVLAVVATAIGFDAWLVQTDLLAGLLTWLDVMIPSSFAFVLVANGLLVGLSLLTGVYSALLLLAPLLLPVAQHYQLDPYRLAAVFALNAELARFIWPPRPARRAEQEPQPEREPLPV